MWHRLNALETDIFFDELGVDCLFFDEAHFYKNALGSAKAAKLGISANKPSQRAEDALQKTRWLFSKIGYKNVFVLTATPVVNSPVEVWHMLNLCAPDLLKEYEIENLDNFINLFVREEEKIVKKPMANTDPNVWWPGTITCRKCGRSSMR